MRIMGKTKSVFLIFTPFFLFLIGFNGFCQKETTDLEKLTRSCLDLKWKGEPLESIECFESLKQKYPTHNEIDIFLARAYLDKKDLSLAESTVNSFISNYPNYASGYNVKCHVLIAKRSLLEAKENCKVALEKDNSNLDYKRNLADVETELGNDLVAEILYKQILEEDPKNISTVISLAKLYEKKDNLDDAIKTLEIALKSENNLKDEIKAGIERLKTKKNLK